YRTNVTLYFPGSIPALSIVSIVNFPSAVTLPLALSEPSSDVMFTLRNSSDFRTYGCPAFTTLPSMFTFAGPQPANPHSNNGSHTLPDIAHLGSDRDGQQTLVLLFLVHVRTVLEGMPSVATLAESITVSGSAAVVVAGDRVIDSSPPAAVLRFGLPTH